MSDEKTPHKSNDPLHGLTLKVILERLVKRYGWDELGKCIKIRCFMFDPTINSSLKFLRQTPWARKQVEELFLLMFEDEGDDQEGPSPKA